MSIKHARYKNRRIFIAFRQTASRARVTSAFTDRGGDTRFGS